MKRQQLGTFPFWVIPLIAGAIASFGILATYFTAVHYGHVKPFPDTDITHAAIHYPEYIIFRSCLIVGAILIAIVMLIVSWWFQVQAEKANVTPSGLNFIGKGGVVAGFLLCLSTASISDGGDMDWVSHVIGATGFFATIVFVILVCTENYIRIYRANKFIPFFSFAFKMILQLIILIFVCIYIYAQVGKDVPSWVGNAVEWVLTLLVILYIASFAVDMRNVEGSITYDHSEANGEEEENETKQERKSLENKLQSENKGKYLRDTIDTEGELYVEMPSYQNINYPLK